MGVGHRTTMAITLQNPSGIPTVLHVSRGGAATHKGGDWTRGWGGLLLPIFKHTPTRPYRCCAKRKFGRNHLSLYQRVLMASVNGRVEACGCVHFKSDWRSPGALASVHRGGSVGCQTHPQRLCTMQGSANNVGAAWGKGHQMGKWVAEAAASWAEDDAWAEHRHRQVETRCRKAGEGPVK